MGGTRGEEVADVITQALEWQRTEGNHTREISEEHKSILRTYSSEEILRGFILKLERYDQNERTKMNWYFGGDEVAMLKFNVDLVPDTNFLRTELAKEKDSRRFYQLAGLAGAFTKTRKTDFISEHFNSLFRDGPVLKDQGQSSPPYAHDVSAFTYERITGSLKYVFEADYEPAPVGGGWAATHERQVNHLAKWLIANWPGCENFSLSDRNVPAVLVSNSVRKIPRGSKSQNEESQPLTKEAFKFSWPMIAAMIFLVGSFAYWRKKKFTH